MLAVWGLLLAGLIGGAGLLGTQYDDSFVIPGTQSQQGQDVLADRFGLTGTSAQVMVTTTSGAITEPRRRAARGTASRRRSTTSRAWRPATR